MSDEWKNLDPRMMEGIVEMTLTFLIVKKLGGPDHFEKAIEEMEDVAARMQRIVEWEKQMADYVKSHQDQIDKEEFEKISQYIAQAKQEKARLQSTMTKFEREGILYGLLDENGELPPLENLDWTEDELEELKSLGELVGVVGPIFEAMLKLGEMPTFTKAENDRVEEIFSDTGDMEFAFRTVLAEREGSPGVFMRGDSIDHSWDPTDSGPVSGELGEMFEVKLARQGVEVSKGCVSSLTEYLLTFFEELGRFTLGAGRLVWKGVVFLIMGSLGIGALTICLVLLVAAGRVIFPDKPEVVYLGHGNVSNGLFKYHKKPYDYQTSWSPTGEWIAVTSYRTFNYGPLGCAINLITPDRSEVVPIEEGDAYCNNPSWSDDGSKLVYNKDNVIYLYNVKTKAKSSLGHLDDSAASSLRTRISPDGEWVLYEHFHTSSTYVISRVRTSGAREREVVGYGYDAEWSPDSQNIVYTSGYSNPILFLVDMATLSQTRLTRGISPDWSPNGKLILYANETSSDVYGIFSITIDGSSEIQVVKSSGDISINAHPEWSPDGNWIAYLEEDDGLHIVGYEDLEVHNMYFSCRTEDEVYTGDNSPSWSPEGGWIVCASGGHPFAKKVRVNFD